MEDSCGGVRKDAPSTNPEKLQRCSLPSLSITAKKLDLKVMIEKTDSIGVPSVFKFPISLEPMQEHVTLCTGQTFNRSNILKWFSLGHKTFPAIMQDIWDDSVTS